jgi:hypothetical protein
MEPWIRRYNYIEDYFKFAHDLYTNEYPAMSVTYYNLDFDSSIMDKDILNAGSYERYGLGDLTGVRWKKILLFPVWGIESIQPNMEPGEKGLLIQESETTQIIYPSAYGIKASELDFVVFDQGFMQTDSNIKPVFVVTQVNLEHYGDYFNMYQCRLKSISNRLDLEQQISSYWMFLEYSKRIYPAENANLLLKLQRKNKILAENLYSFFEDNIGFYLQPGEHVEPY